MTRKSAVRTQFKDSKISVLYDVWIHWIGEKISADKHLMTCIISVLCSKAAVSRLWIYRGLLRGSCAQDLRCLSNPTLSFRILWKRSRREPNQALEHASRFH